MKKTALLAVALATCLGYVPAQAAEVVSSNIVGYEKVNLVQGFNMVGLQFQYVGDPSDTTRNISDFGSLDSTFSGYDADYSYATEMRVWDSTRQGYVYYGWSGSSGTDIDSDPAYDNQWLDSATEITDETLPVGAGVWIKAEKAGSITISGQVVNSDMTVSLVQGFNLVANPYPQAVDVAKFGTLDSSFAGYDADYSYATEMRIWDPARQSYVYYGWSGTSGTDIDGDSSYDNQWLDSATEITTETIPFGAAVWIKAEKAGTITFSAPTVE